MAIIDDLNNDVQNIISAPWDKRNGQKVPETTEVNLSGGAVELDATFLYADLADSSKMAKELDRRIAAKIMKSFLSSTCRVIKSLGGTIVSFDGDRVMAIFIDTDKNSNASICALKIRYVVEQIIKPKFEKNYRAVKNASFIITHAVGIDTGTVLGVRGGARNANDLIWIGRSANLAAKLSDIRQSRYKTYITADVYNNLSRKSKFGVDDKNMWEPEVYDYLGEKITIYKSSYYWKP